jgi:hypothetical protein
MQPIQSESNLTTSRRGSTLPSENSNLTSACRTRHSLLLAIATLGLTFMFNLAAADAQSPDAQGLRPSRFDLVPASDAVANCESMPNPAATVAVFPREDIRGVDTLDLHAEGLRPNTTFAVFLTELPVPPFGAVQYIGDFTTNAAGRGSVRVDAIINEAFAFNNITGVRTDLNHIVFWFADPNDDEDCVPGSAPGHFDGDGESGVAAMSSKNFLPGAPLP